MRSLFGLAATAATLIPLISAAPQSGTVQFDFHKRKVPASAAKLARRQTINTPISNEEVLYLINVTVGTPPQSLGLQLDTGSSDIWFPASNSQYCQSQQGGCPLGSYDSSASSTYSDPNYGPFQIQYVDGTTISGQYITDVFSVGGTNVTNLTMAEAQQTSQGYGIMGVGFDADESSDEPPDNFVYPNIIDVLQSQGKINTRSYSLWLDDLDSNTGSILFGGVDSSKYSGDLITIPIQNGGQPNYTAFAVAWTGLTITSAGQTYTENPSSAQAAILDSGTTELYLPDDIANNILNGVGVTTDEEYGNVVPCSLANDSMTFAFQFEGSGGPTIDVALSEFVLEITDQAGNIPKFRSGQYSGQNACGFGINAAGSDPILFGDTFLRSAYVVYDLDNKNIGLAQSNRNSNANANNVQAFSSGTVMPDAKKTVSSVTVTLATGTNAGPQVQTSATGTGDAGGDSATTRSATFSLSTSTSSSSSGAVPLSVPSLEKSTFAVVGVSIFAFIMGTFLL